VHLAREVTSGVPTHAPQPLVTRPGSVSTFLSHHAHGSPRAWPSHGSYRSRGSPWGGMGTSRVRLLPTGTRTVALKPSFSSPCYCSGLSDLRPPSGVAPSKVFPSHGYLGVTPSTSHLGYVLPWRRLCMVTPSLGDAFAWRRLLLVPP